MSLNAVNLESDVFLVCLTHALSTEREEVMGLLMGEVKLLVLLQMSAQLILSFKIEFFLHEFGMLNTNMKVLFVVNKYF